MTVGVAWKAVSVVEPEIAGETAGRSGLLQLAALLLLLPLTWASEPLSRSLSSLSDRRRAIADDDAAEYLEPLPPRELDNVDIPVVSEHSALSVYVFMRQACTSYNSTITVHYMY